MVINQLQVLTQDQINFLEYTKVSQKAKLVQYYKLVLSL